MSQSPKKGGFAALYDVAERKRAEKEKEATAASTQSTQTTISTPSTLSTHSTASNQPPIAPQRDFMKVPNSLSRKAVPAGLFKGKSKQIYDFLYSKTRGAIQPARSVRLTRREIMNGSHIGSTKTLYINLQHLKLVGLISYQEIVGPHGGNEYTVHLPEEIITQSTLSTQSNSSNSSSNVERVLRVESSMSTNSINVDNKGTSENSKTSFKTNTESNDDDAALRLLHTAERELTGKVSSPEKWAEVAEILVAELRIAAARTTVSSAPAFLAEHLRRRLWKKDKQQLAAESTPIPAKGAHTPTTLELSKCADCGGSGFYYPNGFEAGVAKCKHEGLTRSERSEVPGPST